MVNKIETPEQISKKSKSSFYYTFTLLPPQKRYAMNTVYAFCRMTDDIVDDESLPIQIKQQNLINWKDEFEKSLTSASNIKVLNELSKIINEFNIPVKPFFELIEGMEIDLNKDRFKTFFELKQYCYKVASTVGLMTIPIFGYEDKDTVDYAINLGIALQLTNIIRDVKTDALRGRIYLPLEDLHKFRYTEEELFHSEYNDNFIQLMRFEANRAREYYKIANKKFSNTDKKNLFTARAMQYIYYRLLDKIEHEKYNVFEKKIRVSNFNKVFIAFSVWFKYKFLNL